MVTRLSFSIAVAAALLLQHSPGRGRAWAQEQELAGSARAAFDAALEDYKATVSNFEALRTEFQTADDARRAEINGQLGRQYTLLKRKLDQMIDDALATFRADPAADPQISKLLVDVASHDVVGDPKTGQGGDNYERAFEVIDALIEAGEVEKNNRLLVYGVVAAFVTGELDKAAAWRDLAVAKGVFQDPPPSKETGATEVFGLAATYATVLEKERELWAEELAIRKAEAEADDLPRVKLTTSKGDVVIELFENEAPTAVANFVTLARQGFYDGVVFHRVLPRFMAQGGDPTGTGTGGPGYNIRCECYAPNARKHFRGTLSMAHAGRDTGGSQFFLTFMPTRHLDGRHTAFGRVIEGLPVLAELQRIDPQRPGGAQPDKIVKAEVLRDRGHEYSFEKLPGR